MLDNAKKAAARAVDRAAERWGDHRAAQESATDSGLDDDTAEPPSQPNSVFDFDAVEGDAGDSAWSAPGTPASSGSEDDPEWDAEWVNGNNGGSGAPPPPPPVPPSGGGGGNGDGGDTPLPAQKTSWLDTWWQFIAWPILVGAVFSMALGALVLLGMLMWTFLLEDDTKARWTARFDAKTANVRGRWHDKVGQHMDRNRWLLVGGAAAIVLGLLGVVGPGNRFGSFGLIVLGAGLLTYRWENRYKLAVNLMAVGGNMFVLGAGVFGSWYAFSAFVVLASLVIPTVRREASAAVFVLAAVVFLVGIVAWAIDAFDFGNSSADDTPRVEVIVQTEPEAEALEQVEVDEPEEIVPLDEEGTILTPAEVTLEDAQWGPGHLDSILRRFATRCELEQVWNLSDNGVEHEPTEAQLDWFVTATGIPFYEGLLDKEANLETLQDAFFAKEVLENLWTRDACAATG